MLLRTKLISTVAVLGVLAAALTAVVHSSFTATAKNEGNTFETGSIALSDNDSEKVLFDLDGLEPASAPARKCVRVAYGSTGALKSTVRLFGTTTGALADHLRVKVTRGSFSGTAPTENGCSGFAASSVLFNGSLTAYPDRWEDGIRDPDATWEAGDAAVYEIEVSLADTDEAQGKSATHAFAFEARTA